MKKADLVALGRVVRSDGRDGRLKLKLSEKGPTGFEGASVYIARPGGLEAYGVESLVLDRNAYFLKLRGVDTLAAADALAGAEVLARAADFKRPAAGRYYDFEVIGCRVRTAAGAEIGEVAGLLEAGGQVLLVVRRGDGDVYVPFVEPILVEVDREAREIVVDPPDGLLELNEI
ncbi:MAG: 16S rRNA processing protein RimM [Acidobacteria bacterium]|nr:16S rRNA processing protein RimM [Acidobacteriota bacterium]